MSYDEDELEVGFKIDGEEEMDLPTEEMPEFTDDDDPDSRYT